MAKELETLIITSKTREAIKEYGKEEVRVSEEFLTAFNNHLHATLKLAIARCNGNGRKTLRPEDV